MVRRLADGTLFVGEVTEEIKYETPVIEEVTEDITETLDDILEEKPTTVQRKGGRPPKRK